MGEALVFAFLFGVASGVLYDFFRLIRLIFSSRFFADFLFWIISAFLSFSFLLVFNNGVVRADFFIIMLSGFLLYIFTIGAFTLKAEKNAAKALKSIFIKTKYKMKKFKKVLHLPYRLYYNIRVLMRNPIKKGFWRDANGKKNEE